MVVSAQAMARITVVIVAEAAVEETSLAIVLKM